MSVELIYHRLKYSWLVGVALAFVIFAVVAAYSARMTNDYPSYDHQRGEQRRDTLAKVQKAENALLYPVDDKGNPTAVWVDQDKGLIQISIDEAMSHEVVDLNNQPAGPGAVIPGTAPAPAPAATNAAPAAAAPPASTNAAPVAPAQPATKKPAKPAKPVKTT
jgi:hypothetical protein